MKKKKAQAQRSDRRKLSDKAKERIREALEPVVVLPDDEVILARDEE